MLLLFFGVAGIQRFNFDLVSYLALKRAGVVLKRTLKAISLTALNSAFGVGSIILELPPITSEGSSL